MRNHFSFKKKKGFALPKRNLFCAYPSSRVADTAPLELKSAQSHSAPRGARRRRNSTNFYADQWAPRSYRVVHLLFFRFWARKSFRPPFSKGGGFQRQRLWPPSADGGTLLYFRRIWGFGGLYKRKAPKAPPNSTCLGGKRPPRWGGGPAGARGGPSYLFPGSLRWF